MKVLNVDYTTQCDVCGFDPCTCHQKVISLEYKPAGPSKTEFYTFTIPIEEVISLAEGWLRSSRGIAKITDHKGIPTIYTFQDKEGKA